MKKKKQKQKAQTVFSNPRQGYQLHVSPETYKAMRDNPELLRKMILGNAEAVAKTGGLV